MKIIYILITLFLSYNQYSTGQTEIEQRDSINLSTRNNCCNFIINHLNSSTFEELIDTLQKLEKTHNWDFNKPRFKRNIIPVMVNPQGHILVSFESANNHTMLDSIVYKMYFNPDNREDYSQIDSFDIERKLILKSKGMICFYEDPWLDREIYLSTTKVLFEVIRRQKNRASKTLFGKSIENLNKEELEKLDGIFGDCPIKLTLAGVPSPPPPPPIPSFPSSKKAD